MKTRLDQVATADLTAATTVQQMAEAEGWTADKYCLALAEKIRLTCEPLDAQRERLAQLAAIGGTADKAAAEDLARHETLLSATFQRFVRTAADLAAADPVRNAKAVDTYMHSALKCQRACLLTLSALKSLRDAQAVQ
jgi:hypothetical protein